ncbi:MAG: DUF1592 domain-containing protein [Planctomycetota bacterium]|nr:DUF1592 domain-containing protein [Planctomycetota bacterium]
MEPQISVQFSGSRQHFRSSIVAGVVKTFGNRCRAEALDEFRCAIWSLVAAWFLFAQPAHADDLQSLIDASCVACHDEATETRFDFTKLDRNLDNPDSFRSWVKVFERVNSGEMPPKSEPRPDPELQTSAMGSLNVRLLDANLRQQLKQGRVPSRRLSRLEYEHTLHDLLGTGGDIARYLPPENKSGAFDVVSANQDMSSVHVKGFLAAADIALDEAIQLGPNPNRVQALDYANSRYMKMWFERPVRRGGGTVFRHEDDLIMFRGENYNLRSDNNGVRFPVAGRYKITVTGSAHQARSPVTMSLKKQNDVQGDSELFAAWDVDENFRTVSTIEYFRPGDYFYVSADELEPALDGSVIYNSQPASEFKGEGVRVRKVLVEGPIEALWPPQRTHDLFPGVQWEPVALSERLDDFRYMPVTTKTDYEHIRDAVKALAPRAFRRPVTDKEIDDLTNLAAPSLKARRGFLASARVALRAILISPETLFLTNEVISSGNRQDFRLSSGTSQAENAATESESLDKFRYEEAALTQHSLASRLSYFLWRGPPDEKLLELASTGQLFGTKTLEAQVNRMLADTRSERFIHEFLDQWLDLELIDATTPDAYLYPEYDDVLRRALLAETRLFFQHLIAEDLSISSLIDSKFTFLNRKLAEHYGIPNVSGENMRKVILPADSVRGGILAHASIAKVTANGTVTSPVRRGNFVLTNLLGLPPNPPPPGIGSIEPDTRGATTIRETLEKHQAVESCAACHRKIDPPGFAMECFDPIGNYRQRYRQSKGVRRTASVGLRFLYKDYKLGSLVDCAGTTEDGHEFDGIRDFKMHLLRSKKQLARNLLSKLITFATGAEIQFADRGVVEAILDRQASADYPLRCLIHEVVRSRMFQCR